MASHDPASPQVILLVEDQAIIAMAQADVLSRAGYRALTALSGEEAVKVATQDNEVDLVLMDINLGQGIDGTQAAERILEQRDLPIVFLSAYSDKDTVSRVRNITRYGYVVKNSGDFVLLSSIETALHLFEAHQRVAIGERRLRRAQQLARLGSYEVDLHSRETVWSEQVYRLLDDPAATPSRERILRTIHPDDRAAVDEAVRAARATQDGFEFQYRIIPSDGSVRWIQDRAEYWRDSQGVAVRVFGILQDITEVRQAYRRLHVRSEELDLALAVGGVTIWRYDVATRTLEYRQDSDERSVSSLPRPRTLDELRSVVHPEDLEALERAVNGVIAGRSDEFEVEYRVLGPNDRWRRVLTRGRRVSAADTGMSSIIGASLYIAGDSAVQGDTVVG